MTSFTPAYIELLNNGELEKRVTLARHRLKSCKMCAKKCMADRTQPEKSVKKPFCRTWERAVVDSYGPHFGEERSITGRNGSGTIFFSWCNMKCVYCQNWSVSQLGEGVETTPEILAEVMLKLQAQGCHNINLVSPSHVIFPVISSIYIAAQRGLRLPIVYNSGGYDSPEGLALMDGIVDIYMPDMKYGDDTSGRKYSGVAHYPEVNMAAVKEMYRQVGNMKLNRSGVAIRGLLIRHLILPNGLAGSEKVLSFISGEISKDTHINLMDQYRPCFRADKYPELKRPISVKEFNNVMKIAERLGLSPSE